MVICSSNMENIALFARHSCEFRYPRNLKCLIRQILIAIKQKRNLSYCRNDNLFKKVLTFSVYYPTALTVIQKLFLAINQLNAQNLFYNTFITCLYMFRALCAHHQEVNIVLYSIWYHHTCRWPSRAQVERRLLSTCAPGGHLQV